MDYPDPVFVFLQSQGCSRAVVAAGLPGLVATWERIVESVAEGYQGSLEQYLNDMDTRELLNEAWQTARRDQQEESAKRLDAVDRHMRGLVIPTTHCLYGDLVAEDEGWTAESHWWYFSRPAAPGRLLMTELRGGAAPGADP
ncbi:MAG TPA: hypothetical protein VGA78_11015 [Gemmatimonadales bacterium]